MDKGSSTEKGASTGQGSTTDEGAATEEYSDAPLFQGSKSELQRLVTGGDRRFAEALSRTLLHGAPTQSARIKAIPPGYTGGPMSVLVLL